MPAIRNRRGSGRLYVRYAGAGLSHDALGSGNAHKETIGNGIQKGVRRWAHRQASPDAWYVADSLGCELLVAVGAVCATSNQRYQGIHERQ